MTAEKFIKGCEHDGSYIPVNEVLRLMKEYARLMCDKQKEICAKKAVTGAYVKLRRKGARYKQLKDNEDFDMFNTTQMYKVEKNSILNAPYPNEIQ